MENDILDALEDLRYDGPILENDVFDQAIGEGPRSAEYTKCVEWITKELSAFYSLEECVNAITNPNDSETFLMELSGFLREYGCPHKKLSDGPISKRLSSRESKLLLLDFLLSELCAAHMIAVNKPQLITKAMEVEQTAESEVGQHMKRMLITLGFPKPPDGITPFQLFSKVESKVKELLTKTSSSILSKPLLKARLSEKQWDTVEFINKALVQEYECRREMLLKRLDVTVQSFKWSDKAKQNEDKMAAVYQPMRRCLSAKNEVSLPHLLAARDDLLQVEKTSSGTAREKTKCPINRVKIGHVPDRGGRAYEHEIPPPEMPSFQKRQNQPQQQRQQGERGRRGGGRGDHRGGSGGGRDHTGGSSNWGDQAGRGGGGWGQGAPQYSTQQNVTPGQAFFGGGGQYGAYQGAGYQQSGGYQGGNQPGGYQQGGYQQGGYQQGGYQQGNYQQGSYQKGGYQQTSGNQQGGYQQGGGNYRQGNGNYQGNYQDQQASYQGGGGNYQGGGGRGGRGGGRGRGGRGNRR